MIVHNLKSEHTCPTIVQGDQTTNQTIGNAHINSIIWGEQSHHDLAMIKARYRQDPSNWEDNGHDAPMWDLSVHFYTGGTHKLSPTCQKTRNRLE